MTKYNSDIADSASALMQLPNNLEGILQEVKGQTEVTASPHSKEESAPVSSPSKNMSNKKSKYSKQKLSSNEDPRLASTDAMWQTFCSNCELEENTPKTVGKDGVTSFCKVDKDILTTFRLYAVGGYSNQTLINAILRSFILHYKKEFSQFRTKGKSIL